METKATTTTENEREGKLKGRLKSVQKRKRAGHNFECEVVALKMQLVEVEEEDDR